jgi:hypothetical protein
LHCRRCGVGRYSLAGNRGGCLLCPPGRFGLGGSVSAACGGSCPAGRYGDGGSRNADCTAACPAGRFSLPGTYLALILLLQLLS